MAASDAKQVPKKNVAFRLYFWIINSTTGAVITGATGLDAEVSIDGGAFADCSGTETEIGRGQYYVDLTSAEMNGDHIGFYCSSTSTNAQPVMIDLYPADRDIDDLAFPTTSGRSMDVDASGGVEVGSFQAGAITAAAIAADAITAAKVADGTIDAATFAAGAINAAAIATDAITAAKIADGAIDAATFAAGAINAAAIGADAITAAKIADGAIDAATFAAGAINAAAIATDAITAAKIAADAIGASELAADAVTEIQSGLATAAALTTVGTNVLTVAGYVDTEVAAILAAVDTEVAAIKAKTDNLPAAPAAVSDVPTSAAVAAAVAAALKPLEGTALSGTTTSFVLALGVSDTDDAYNGRLAILTYADGSKDFGYVEDYVGATHTVTLNRTLVAAVSATTDYALHLV